MSGTDADEFDVGGEGAQAPDLLNQLRAQIDEAIKLDEMIEQMENDLTAAKKNYQAIRTGRIPDIMAQIQSDHFTYGGYEVKIDDFVSGNLPKETEARNKAIDYLVSTGNGGLLKTTVAAEFGRSQHNEAADLYDRIKAEGHAVELQSGVHTQTLLKFARDAIASGADIDLDTLGLYTGKVAKLKPVKEKAAPKGRR